MIACHIDYPFCRTPITKLEVLAVDIFVGAIAAFDVYEILRFVSPAVFFDGLALALLGARLGASILWLLPSKPPLVLKVRLTPAILMGLDRLKPYLGAKDHADITYE